MVSDSGDSVGRASYTGEPSVSRQCCLCAKSATMQCIDCLRASLDVNSAFDVSSVFCGPQCFKRHYRLKAESQWPPSKKTPAIDTPQARCGNAAALSHVKKVLLFPSCFRAACLAFPPR